MFRKALSLVLISLLLYLVVCAKPVSASSKAEKQARFIEKVRAGILKLGIGEEARISVKLRDKTKLAGYVSEAGKDSFVITNPKNGTMTSIAYANVAQVRGHNLSRRANIIIGVALVAFIFIIAFATGRGD